jgi:SSS family transporter
VTGSIPVVVFALYFIVTFGIGFWSMRRARDESEYWIAGGRLGWLLGGATIAATHVSAGSFIGTIGVIYTAGWSFAWIVLSIPAAYWFLTAVLAPRFTRTRELTLSAFLESRYQSLAARRLSAAIILVAIVVYLQAQVVAGGLIGNIVFGISPGVAMAVFTFVLLAYTAMGGLVAIVYNDFVQLVIMVFGVLLALPIALGHLGGPGELFEHLNRVSPDAFGFGSLPPSRLVTMGIAFTLGTVATPEKLVRLYSMKDMRHLRRGALFAFVAATGINLVIFIIALATIVLFPALPTGDLAMPLVASSVLPPLLGALLLAAIAAAIMSTASALMLVAGSALARDLYGTVRPGSTDRERMRVARVGIVIVGTAPLVLIGTGVGAGELVQFIVLLYTSLMASSFFVPVVIGVYWSRATKEGTLAAMTGGMLTCLLWKAFGSGDIDPVLPGLVVSALLFFTVSLWTKPPPESAFAPYRSDAARSPSV